jgi:hypothetical protein
MPCSPVGSCQHLRIVFGGGDMFLRELGNHHETTQHINTED